MGPFLRSLRQDWFNRFRHSSLVPYSLSLGCCPVMLLSGRVIRERQVVGSGKRLTMPMPKGRELLLDGALR